MRSPLRLGSVVVGFIVVVWAISHLTGAPEPTTTSGHAHGPHAAAKPSASVGASQAPQPSPVPTAVAFVTAWAKPSLPQSQWLAGVNAAHPDESFAQALSTTDPRTVPATKVVGTPKVLEQSPAEARVQVGTDGPTVIVVLTWGDNVWSVSNILPGG